MLFNNEVVQEDLMKIISDNTIDWNMLNHKTVLVTGATGMLAKYVTFVMMFLNQKCNYNIKVYILVRNAEKAQHTFFFDRICAAGDTASAGTDCIR